MGFFDSFVDIINPVKVLEKTIDVTKDVIDTTIDVTENVVNETIDFTKKATRETVKAVEDTTRWSYDVTESVVRTQWDLAMSTADIAQFIDNPNKYIDQVNYDFFMGAAEPLGVAIGDKELAIEITYYLFIVAAIVLSIFFGPEISAAVDAMLMLVMEMIAAQVVLTAVTATILYFVLIGIGYLASSYLIAELSNALLSIPNDVMSQYYDELAALYASLYALEEHAKKVTNQYVSMFMDGTINDWMAGGVMYDSPRAGNVLFNPAGNLNTVSFLGLENRNYSPDMQVAFANPNMSRQTFGNFAGDTGFNVMSFGQN